MFIDFDWSRYDLNDEVHCMIKPLEEWALQEVMKLFQNEMKEGDTPEMVKAKFSNVDILMKPEIPELAKKVLPEHAKDLEGLEVRFEGEEKRKATIQDIATSPKMKLTAVTMLMYIFSKSSLGMNKMENLKKQLAGSSTEVKP